MHVCAKWAPAWILCSRSVCDFVFVAGSFTYVGGDDGSNVENLLNDHLANWLWVTGFLQLLKKFDISTQLF